MKTVVNTEKAPGAIGPYSQGIGAGNVFFFSGQLPIDPETGEMPAGIEAQAAQSLENVGALLRSQGMDYSNVVKTTVFLADMDDFAAVNEVYAKYFSAPYPARSAFEVGRLPKGGKIEIEVIAVRD